MQFHFLLIPLVGLLGISAFVGFWCLIAKVLSLMGWQRLAQYQVARPLGWPIITLRLAKIGGIRYQSVIRAGAQAEGLALETMFLFRIGHPPLLIPWSAIGPVLVEKSFWTTSYTTSIRTAGGSVNFAFNDDGLASELRSWLAMAGQYSGA